MPPGCEQAVAVILVHEPKKTFYKKFLYEPFPVESCLHEQLHDHINAEVVAGTIRSKQERALSCRPTRKNGVSSRLWP